MARTIAATRTAASTRTAGSTRSALGADGTGFVQGTLLEDFQTGWAITSGGAVTNNDTTHFKTGTGALKCVSTSGTNLFATKTGVSMTLATVGAIGFWVFVDSSMYGDATPALQIAVDFRFSKDGFTTSITWGANMSLEPGWNWVQVGRGDATINGSTTYSDTFTSYRLKVNSVTGKVVTVWFDSVYTQPRSVPLLVLEFDDIWDNGSDYTYMTARGLRGSFAFNSTYLDAANRLTTSAFQTLYDAGWDAINHTDDHTNLGSGMAQATALARIAAGENAMIAGGWTRNQGHKHFAWPHGAYDTGALAAVAEQGCLTARGTLGRTGVPPFIDNQYILGQVYINGLTMNSGATLIALVKRVLSAQGICRLVFHRVIAGSPSVAEEIGQTAFRALIDWIGQRNGAELVNVTWPEAYNLMVSNRRLVK